MQIDYGGISSSNTNFQTANESQIHYEIKIIALDGIIGDFESKEA